MKQRPYSVMQVPLDVLLPSSQAATLTNTLKKGTEQSLRIAISSPFVTSAINTNGHFSTPSLILFSSCHVH